MGGSALGGPWPLKGACRLAGTRLHCARGPACPPAGFLLSCLTTSPSHSGLSLLSRGEKTCVGTSAARPEACRLCPSPDGGGGCPGGSALAPGPSRCPWRAAAQSPGHSLELRSGMGATRGVDEEASLCPPCPLSSVTQKGSQCEAPGGLLPPSSRRPALAGACFLHYVTRQV